jgi:hypothetical protein
MAINWPIASATGEAYTYTDPISSKSFTWTWTGDAWKALGEYIAGPTGPTGAAGATGATADNAQIPINPQTADYTLTLSDAGSLIKIVSGVTSTLTVPPNSSEAFVTGTQFVVVRGGVGEVGITGGAGVTLNSAQGYFNLNYQYSAATLIKIDTDEWYVFGDLKS